MRAKGLYFSYFPLSRKFHFCVVEKAYHNLSFAQTCASLPRFCVIFIGWSLNDARYKLTVQFYAQKKSKQANTQTKKKSTNNNNNNTFHELRLPNQKEIFGATVEPNRIESTCCSACQRKQDPAKSLILHITDLLISSVVHSSFII